MPPWLSTAAKIGVPSLIALYLTYAMVSSVTVEVKATKEMLMQHNIATAATHESLSRVEDAQRAVVEILRATCVNAAKTMGERNDCLRAGR